MKFIDQAAAPPYQLDAGTSDASMTWEKPPLKHMDGVKPTKLASGSTKIMNSGGKPLKFELKQVAPSHVKINPIGGSQQNHKLTLMFGDTVTLEIPIDCYKVELILHQTGIPA